MAMALAAAASARAGSGMEFGFRGADLFEQVAGFDIAQEDLQGEGGDIGDFPEQCVLLVGQRGEESNFQHCEDSFPREKGKKTTMACGEV